MQVFGEGIRVNDYAVSKSLYSFDFHRQIPILTLSTAAYVIIAAQIEIVL